MHDRMIYKIDTKGKTRVWWIEYDNEKYRTHSGILDGKIVVSGWQFPKEKNIGRSNATTVSEQVIAEVEAEYTKKLNQGKYHETLDETSNGAKFIECMLAVKYDPNKHNKYPYYSQPKLDGIRCLVSKDGMQSRNGKSIVSCPHILEELEPFFQENPDVVLDGELYNHEFKDDFEKIVSLVRKTKPTVADLEESKQLVQYHVYDCITDESFELYDCITDESFEQRICITIGHFYGDDYASVKAVNGTYIYDKEDLEEWLHIYLEQGYEGQMLRVPNSIYEGKRSKNLIKHKEFEDDEFEIIDIEEGEGNWAGYAKSIKILLKDGTTQSSNMRGKQEFNKQILAEKHQYIGGEATIVYQKKTADGKLRFPVAKTLFKNKRDF